MSVEVRHQRGRREAEGPMWGQTSELGREAQGPLWGSSSFLLHGLFILHAMSLPWGFNVLNKLIRVLSFERLGEKVTSFIVCIQLSKAHSSLSIYLSPNILLKELALVFLLNHSFSLYILTETRKYLAHIHFCSLLFRFRHLCSRYKINFLLFLRIWIAYDE